MLALAAKVPPHEVMVRLPLGKLTSAAPPASVVMVPKTPETHLIVKVTGFVAEQPMENREMFGTLTVQTHDTPVQVNVRVSVLVGLPRVHWW